MTARLAYLDFRAADMPNAAAGQSVGPRLPQSTVGVNWYLADYVRLMFNFTYSLSDDPNTGMSAASIFVARLNVYW